VQITEEFLRQALAEFGLQRDEALKQLGAVNGAMQFCEFLINKMEESLSAPPGESDGVDGAK